VVPSDYETKSKTSRSDVGLRLAFFSGIDAKKKGQLEVTEYLPFVAKTAVPMDRTILFFLHGFVIACLFPTLLLASWITGLESVPNG